MEDLYLPAEFDMTFKIEELVEDSPFFREKLHKDEMQLESTSNELRNLIKLSKQYITSGMQFKDQANQFANQLVNFNFENIPSSVPTLLQVKIRKFIFFFPNFF